MTEYCKNNPDDPLCSKKLLQNYYINQRPAAKRSTPRRKGSTYKPTIEPPRRPDRRFSVREQEEEEEGDKGFHFMPDGTPMAGSTHPDDPPRLRRGVPQRRKRKIVGGGGIAATKPINASHSELTSDEIMKAKMLEAGKIVEIESKNTNMELFLDENTRLQRLQFGLNKAQEYLDQQGIKYTIEPELSTTEGLILINNETGVPKGVFRGTNFKNISDLKTDLALVHGTEDLTAQFKSSKEQVQRTNEIYEPIDELIGFSKGGAQAISIGQELGIKTTTFNPAVSPAHLKNVPLNSGDNHTIIRTTENPTDILAGLKPTAFKIKSILPLNEPKWLDPKSALAVHDLKNFSQTGSRRSNNIEVKAAEIQRSGTRHHELIGLHEAKSAIEGGGSFSDYIRDQHPADIDAAGKLSNRLHIDSKIFRMWDRAGGGIDGEEADMLIENSEAFTEQGTPVSEFALEEYEMDNLIGKSATERSSFIEGKATELVGLHAEVEPQLELHNANRSALKASLSPANIGVGVIGGIAGAKVADLIDPNDKLGGVGHQALSGALGGGFTAGAVATLGAEALTLAAGAGAVVGGGLGAVVGYETNKAVANSLTKAGANRDTVESISDITAGAAGGTAAALTGIGASALLGAEIGELGGVAGVVLGAGLGAAFGLGAYAVDAIKYNAPKAKAKRYEMDRLNDIANEAGYDTYEEFATQYHTEDTYNGQEISPEDNYMHERRVDLFGYDNVRSKPLNTEELLRSQINYDERIDAAVRQREFERTNPRARRAREAQGGMTMGGGGGGSNPYRSEGAIQQAQAETIRESRGGVNRDGSVTPSEVSKVTQEIQN
jgi:hypothetical protein